MIDKGVGKEKYMLPGELATFLGVTTRTVRRWMHDSTFPKHSARTEKGYKLWSPEQARKVLEWRLKRVA